MDSLEVSAQRIYFAVTRACVYVTDSGQFKPRSELITDFLYDARKLPQAGSALDIGSGNGPFLRAMWNRFPGWSLTGADVTDRFGD